MSARVPWSAVAVKASIWALGKASAALRSCRYSGLKSCPHWETQCASSTTMRATPMRPKSVKKSSRINRSGATYRRRTSPA